MAREPIEDAYSRARRDPGFLEAVRRDYRGRHDALHALWWLVHPTEPAPDGTPSPLQELRDLQRRVFSADGGSLGDSDATRSISELQAEASVEREAIEDAVAAASEGRAPGLESLFPAEGPLGGAVDSPGAASAGASKRTRKVVVLVGIVAAAAGVVAGTQFAGARVEAAPPASPTPAVTAKVTCDQMTDVVTILMNAAISRAETRTTEQEWQGAAALAARVLDRVDTAEGTTLARRIAELRVVMSTVDPTEVTPDGLSFRESSTWNLALHGVFTACDAAGAPFVVQSWAVG
ncbi:hypothetical protein E3T54_04010 [Cryobacterium sp. Sr8]|uniref:hypothetical protein n=1 Tax=Cryobacterium sp. Sr8 TaxID=1259203 RepID=UPI00106B8B01|nr:hypothetical protein [Cryobacterium sp. Sr8]TFD80103.1 hypothetical protein E3T54_04010 [Cryobacterium sp. Sr8]